MRWPDSSKEENHMAGDKYLMAAVGCRNQKAVLPVPGEGFVHGSGEELSFLSFAEACSHNGLDGLCVFDLSESDEEHEKTIGAVKEAVRVLDIPVFLGGRIKRLEDVKKYLYAGAEAVFLDGGNEDNIDLIKEAADRFGTEKIAVFLSAADQMKRVQEFCQLGAGKILAEKQVFLAGGTESAEEALVPFLILTGKTDGDEAELLKQNNIEGVIYPAGEPESGWYMKQKQKLSEQGISVDILKSQIPWSQFRTNQDDLIPVIVQDYKTSEVLMLAYMNEQAFEDTLRTGKMHYFSRSRQSQWEKGETSGHFQYVKALFLDCDNDTLLAKVHQIGAACHTGSRSCFFQTLAQKEYQTANPLKVFEDVFAVIQDRKLHPKEGSYTNYLFDKGIDKILKKVGEEATEIVIAAKNPDPEEVKYEISDFLYHVMVLMAEKGVTWEEITQELANR